MKATEYIIRMCSEKTELTKNDHAVCRALIYKMSAEEKAELLESDSIDWYVRNIAENGETIRSPRVVRNKSWREYMRLMKDRKSGKVQEARANLQRLFPYLEWSAQCELLLYFLTNGIKTDRIWALRTIDYDFGIISEYRGKSKDLLTDTILRLWLRHHDDIAARIIIQNYPYETVLLFAELLSQDYDYVHVALRLGEDADYHIDAQRLTDIEHLYVLAKLQRKVCDEDAETMFYLVMLTALSVEDDKLPRNGQSLMSIDHVKLGVWCLGRLGKSELIMEFYENDCNFSNVARQELPSGCDATAFWHRAKGKLSSFFPGLHRIKRMVLEDMMRRNSAIRKLVERLDLHIV